MSPIPLSHLYSALLRQLPIRIKLERPIVFDLFLRWETVEIACGTLSGRVQKKNKNERKIEKRREMTRSSVGAESDTVYLPGLYRQRSKGKSFFRSRYAFAKLRTISD